MKGKRDWSKKAARREEKKATSCALTRERQETLEKRNVGELFFK